MDDDQQSDDHGIFSELSGDIAASSGSAPTSSSPALAVEAANTDAVNLEHLLQDDQIGTIVTDADGNEVVVIGHMPQSTTPTAVLQSNVGDDDVNGAGDGGHRGEHSAGEDDGNERVLHELESPKAAAAAHKRSLEAHTDDQPMGIEVEIDGRWQSVGDDASAADANADQHHSAIVSISAKRSASPAATGANPSESGVDRARRQLQQLTHVIKSRPKKSLEKSADPSSNGGNQLAATAAAASVAADHGAKVLNVEIIKPAGSIPSNQLIKSMQSRLSQKIDQILVVAPAHKQRTISAQSDYSASGIEIPKEFIVPVSLQSARSDELHETDIVIEAGDHQLETTSFIISTADDLSDVGGEEVGAEELPDADLLAILEGNDGDEGDEHRPAVGATTSPAAALDKDSEMELALQQMMSLPQKRKGRPCKPKPEVSPPPTKGGRSSANRRGANSNNELLNTLVQDWSGGSEDEDEEMEVDEEEDVKPPLAAKKSRAAVAAPVAISPPATFKRSRIIKKKVIWDPDAPETAVSYASRVQPAAAAKRSGPLPQAGAAKVAPPRILNKIPASLQLDRNKTRTPPLLAKPRRPVQGQQAATGSASAGQAQVQAQALQQRKRKVSEVDRLLRDEGAINMLNALKRESMEREEEDEAAVADENEAHNTPISPAQKQSKSPAAPAAASDAVGQRRTKRPHTPAAAAPTTSPSAIKKEATAGVKRPRKSTANTSAAADSSANSWDYIYSHRGEDSLIIRRRSNSSYSSSTSTNRLSVDARDAAAEPAATKAATAAPVGGKQRVGRPAKGASFEFAKPSARRSAAASDSNAEDTTILQDIRSKPAAAAAAAAATSPVASQPASSSSVAAAETRRSKRGAPTSAEELAAPTAGELNQLNAKERKIVAKLNSTGVVATVVKSPTATPASKAAGATVATTGGGGDYQEIELKRRGAVVQVVLQPFSGKLENVFTVQLMREVRKALHSLSTDTGCKVVLISSATATFCNGLDYTVLQLTGTPEKRRASAQTLATEVSQFIESLASFPKTLVAAVHGRCVGIGVTILPLFDVVWAKETATFETPFARAGQLPEASSVLQLSTKVAHNAKSELLLLGETLDAKEAQQAQLVTQVLGANGFETEVQRRTAALAAHSAQALDSMKAVAQSAELTSLPIRMADEQKLLQQHWCSAEWQESFKRYLATKQW